MTLDAKSKFTVAQTQGILAKDIRAPALEGWNRAFAGREQVEVGSRGDQLLRHPGFFAAGLEEHAQQISQRRVHLQLVAPILLDLRQVFLRAIEPGLHRGKNAVCHLAFACFA